MPGLIKNIEEKLETNAIAMKKDKIFIYRMKLSIVILIVNFIVGCYSSDKSSNNEDKIRHKSAAFITGKNSFYIQDTSKKELSDKKINITVSYAAIACGCPQWFETKYKNVKFLEGVERYYLEPTDTSLLNANNLWDGEHLPLTLKLTGRFSKGKETPPTYHIKDEPEKARIFWYDKITVVFPSYRKNDPGYPNRN